MKKLRKKKEAICEDCGCEQPRGIGPKRVSSINGHYMVNHNLWRSVFGEGRGLLCVTCFQIRLGRKLTPQDFKDCSLNRRLGSAFNILCWEEVQSMWADLFGPEESVIEESNDFQKATPAEIVEEIPIRTHSPWTKAQQNWVLKRGNAKRDTVAKFNKRFGTTRSQAAIAVKLNKLKKTVESEEETSTPQQDARCKWTPQMLKDLKKADNARKETCINLNEKYGTTLSQKAVYSRLRRIRSEN